MKDILKCYISGRPLPGNTRQGIVSFAVPEYGILFRCLAQGSRIDLEVIALMSFLRFADHNLEIFGQKRLYVFTDYPILALIISDDSGGGQGAEAVRKEAEKFAQKLGFQIALIDAKSNRAAKAVGLIPEMPEGCDLKIKTFANPSAPDAFGGHPYFLNL